MSKNAPTPAFDADEALRLLEESLSYYSPVPLRKATWQDYEDLPLAA